MFWRRGGLRNEARRDACGIWLDLGRMDASGGGWSNAGRYSPEWSIARAGVGRGERRHAATARGQAGRLGLAVGVVSGGGCCVDNSTFIAEGHVRWRGGGGRGGCGQHVTGQTRLQRPVPAPALLGRRVRKTLRAGWWPKAHSITHMHRTWAPLGIPFFDHRAPPNQSPPRGATCPMVSGPRHGLPAV